MAVEIHNNAFGRKRKDQIKDPKKLFQFAWEDQAEPKLQTVEEMKQFMLGMAEHSGIKVTTKKDRDGTG